jgi:hypothetical protein
MRTIVAPVPSPLSLPGEGGISWVGLGNTGVPASAPPFRARTALKRKTVDVFCRGSARASRAGLGAPAETNLLIDWNVARAFSALFKVRDREGAIASTRGRVRSPESHARATWLRGRSDVPRSRSYGCDCLLHAAVAGRSQATARDSVLECGSALPLS